MNLKLQDLTDLTASNLDKTASEIDQKSAKKKERKGKGREGAQKGSGRAGEGAGGRPNATVKAGARIQAQLGIGKQLRQAPRASRPN